MDSQTTKELVDLQEQISSILTRKRRRESEDLQDKVEHLKCRLAASIDRCQKVNATKAELSRKYEQLKSEKGILEKNLEQQAESILDLTEALQKKEKMADSLREEIGTLEEKHFKSGIRLEKLEEREMASKRVIYELKAKFAEALQAISDIDDTAILYWSLPSSRLTSQPISTLDMFTRITERLLPCLCANNQNSESPTSKLRKMVSPADHIRELSFNNKHLAKKNENLRVENHNLKTTNDMLKNKAARDQAIMNAAATIKDLEKYNQTLEDENIHLREQLELFAEKKKIDDQLVVLRTEVVEIDNELVKRMVEMDIIEKLEEKIKALKDIDAQEIDESNTEDDGEDDLKDSEEELKDPEDSI
ncbi:hypothetical protein E4T39_07886 [Aureobasidium subglaciale]|nr:hypothetical protein E4T39_07886 [Aureobasidium subglaciale]